MNAVEAIRQAEQSAKLKAAADFQLLAELLAAGDPAPADAVAILNAAGRSADDLERAVAVAAERQRLKPLADSLPQILSDKTQAEADLKAGDEAAAAELEAVRGKIVSRLSPLRLKVEELRQKEHNSRAAKIRLQNLAVKPNDARRHALVEVGEG